MNRIYLILQILLITVIAFSQNEANIWYFGDHAGLDFNSGYPVPLTNSAMWQAEGVASISDSQGNLLFYTDGITIWNKEHEIMDNGTGLMGGISSTQSGIIVPQPGNSVIYYVFTVPQEIGTNGLRYTIVDLSMNGGLGTVTSKNNFLVQPTEEKVTAVRHDNNMDVWVITHTWNSDAFYCYLVTSAGVSTSPVITNIGSYHSGIQGNTHGYLRASPCGDKIAIIVRPIDSFEIFDFDNSTGIISNPLTFPSELNTPYGIEFSPDESRIYISDYGAGSKIYQYDLEAGLPEDIFNSKTVIGTVSTQHNGALQLGPDQKIYSSYNTYTNGYQYLGIIHNPNELGTSCNFEANGLYLGGAEAIFGLPNFIQSYFCITQNFNYNNVCLGDTTFFLITNSIDLVSVLWNFDDPASGSANSSTELNPFHVFTSPGTYAVKLISNFTNFSDTLTKEVIVYPIPMTNLGNDTSICINESIILDPGQNFSEYLWQDGSTNSTFYTDTAGLYWVEVSNEFGCYNSDSIHIDIFPFIPVYLGNDTLICSNQPIILYPGPGFTSYLWQDGSSDSSLIINESGLFWVQATDLNGCSSSDTIQIDLLPAPIIDIGNDTLICEGDNLLLNAGGGYLSYLWNTGSTDTIIVIDTSGTYYVEVLNEFGCCTIDSILIEFYPMALEELEIGTDTIFCPGTNFVLNAGSGYTLYQWQDGSSDSIFIADTSGVYWVYVENPCSYGADTIVLDVYPQTIIDLGNDTIVCHDESILLDPGFGFESYLWQDGSSNQFLYTNQSGSYWVQIEDVNSCYTSDTINLEFILPDPNIGSDTAICSGDSITFFASNEFVNYLWYDGSDQVNLTSGSEGLIWCEVIDTLGCTGSDSLFLDILFPPSISLGNDTVFCIGDSLWLFALPWSNEFDISWYNGSSDSACLIWQEGEFWVMATNGCGTSKDSIFISVEQLPLVNIGNDTIIAMNTQIELNAGEGFESYLWSEGSEMQTITISEGGSYWVNVFDGLCNNTDTIFIEPIECDLFIPIVFTPNWDGSNDYFFAEASKDIIDFNLTVFNRWGEQMWETQDKDAKWDGQRGTTHADEGTYFWVLRYKCIASPIQFEKKGSVTLLR